MKVFAKIGMFLDLSEEEHKQLLEEAGTNHYGCSNKFYISPEFARRFIKDGELVENDNYIPQGCIASIIDLFKSKE